MCLIHLACAMFRPAISVSCVEEQTIHKVDSWAGVKGMMCLFLRVFNFSIYTAVISGTELQLVQTNALLQQ